MRPSLTILAILLTSCTGCDETITEYSPVLSEEAIISEAVYTPSRHESRLEFSILNQGPFGVSYSGNPGVHVGNGLQVSSIDVPEKFAVVFKCQHGKFIIEKASVYQALKGHEGSPVSINYREVYRTTYSNKNGDRVMISRKLVDYDFLQASLIKSPDPNKL